MIHSVFERYGSVETMSFILVCKKKNIKVESYMFFLYIEMCHV